MTSREEDITQILEETQEHAYSKRSIEWEDVKAAIERAYDAGYWAAENDCYNDQKGYL